MPAALLLLLQDGVTRSRARPSTRSLPDWALSPDAAVFLNIPMDAETPRWATAAARRRAWPCWAEFSCTGLRCGCVAGVVAACSPRGTLLHPRTSLLPCLALPCPALPCLCDHSMRLLRPQALVQEEAIRYWATTTAYR